MAQVEVTTGAFWRPLPDTITYDASVPLFYKSKWRDLPAFANEGKNNFCKAHGSPACDIINNIAPLLQYTKNELTHLNAGQNLRFPISRETGYHKIKKRGLSFLGDFFHWCCDIVTNRQLGDIFTSESAMENQIKMLANGLNTTYSQVATMSQYFQLFENQTRTNFEGITKANNQIVQNLKHLETKFYSNLGTQHVTEVAISHSHHTLLQHFIVLTQIFRQEQILAACKHHQIPGILLTPKDLQKDLYKLQSELSESNRHLAVSPNDITRYFQLPLCECKHTENHIYLHVKIPISNKQGQWKLFELITTPFTWQHQVCSIEHPPSVLAVFSPDHAIRLISGLGLHQCQPHETGLCFLPRFSPDHIHGPSCAELLYTGATTEALNAHCPFKCHTSNRPTISEITPDTFVITNLQPPASVYCNTIREEIDPQLLTHPGAIKVHVPCNCALLTGKYELISPRFPCPNNITRASTITHVIPAAWSTLKSFVVNPADSYTNPKFLNFSECLNSNWTIDIPFINITSNQETMNAILQQIREVKITKPIHITSIERDSWFLV